MWEATLYNKDREPVTDAATAREAVGFLFDLDMTGLEVMPVEPDKGVWLIPVGETVERILVAGGYAEICLISGYQVMIEGAK